MLQENKIIELLPQVLSGDRLIEELGYLPAYNETIIEPCNRVTEPVECENPFVRSSKEREYMLLNRLQLDCKYYINCAGKCRSSSLWADIDTIIKEMENIMDSFTEEEKPEWLTDADFEALKNEIKEIQEHEAENVQ